ncbi:MAG: TlpA family protein disulfide reductase [Pseudomonadales bacterium]
MKVLPILLLLLVCRAFADPGSPSGEVGIGQTLPDVVLQGLNGPSSRMADFRGKPLIINVWASWCGPCRAEMSSLERLAWQEGAGAFNVIGVSTDDFPQRAQSYLQSTNATLTHFIDRQLTVERLLGASRVPLTVLVDSQGRILKKVYGARDWDGTAALQLIDSAFGTALAR